MSEVSHSFVFKLKCLSGSREDTRRYGFAGQLQQKAVFTGLYDRTAQVFSLVPGQFQLEFTPPSGQASLLHDYNSFVAAVCQSTLSPIGLANAKIDEKNRIVLHFTVKHGAPTTSTASQTEDEAVSSTGPPAADDVHNAAAAVTEAAAQLERDIEAVVAETNKVGFKQTAEMEQVMAGQAASSAGQSTISYPSTQFGAPASTSPYHWSWSIPPAPPRVPLGAVPGAPQSVGAAEVGLSAKSNGGTSFGSGTKKDWLKRQVELTQAKRAAINKLKPVRPQGASFGANSGYRTSYVDSVASSSVKGFSAYAAPNGRGLHLERNAAEGDVVDPWAKTKSMLSTFVIDMNKHLADNFGDHAAGFELSLADEGAKPAAQPAPAQPKVEAEVKPTEPVVVHYGVVCDSCAMHNIKGVRHKCRDCSNYDVCTKCLSSVESFHPGHSFQEISKPASASASFPYAGPSFGSTSSFAATTVARAVNLTREAAQEVQRKANLELVHRATCDSCQKDIKGVRHKCTNCPDYDLCAKCVAGADAIHPTHNFVQIDHPSKLTHKPVTQNIVAHRSIVCDGCGALPIVGPRFKCTHDECADVDFCGSCVSDPIARHPVSHNLLLIREPAKSKEIKACVERVRANEAKATTSVPASSSSLPEDVRSLLQAIGRSPAGKSTVTSSELTEDPVSGEQTLVVDVDASELGVADREIHIPLTVPAFSTASVVADEIKSVLSSSLSPSQRDAELASSAPDSEALIREAEQEVGQEVEEPRVEKEDEVVEDEVVAAVVDKLDACFVADVTLTDGSVLPAGAEFHKVWAVMNCGTKAWPVGTRLVSVGGFSKVAGQAAALSFEVPAAAVGEVVDLQAELKAPEESGPASDFWRLQDADGKLFGHRLWVNIVVESSDDSSATASSMSSSIVAPSINAMGKTQSSLAPSTMGGVSRATGGVSTAAGTSATGASELASVAGTEIRASELESSDSEDDISSDEDDDLSEGDSEDSEEYIVLTDEAPLSSDDDF